jgi:hypothetical protein
MIEIIIGLIFAGVMVCAFSGAMLIVIDKQNEWNHRNRK